MRDPHVHSNYSDGEFLPRMVAAAEKAGLAGVGFADHAAVASRETVWDARATYGFNLDLTHERRRRAIDRLRREHRIEIYDAVEVDHDPRDERDIEAFLDRAGFDYAIGSVHAVGGRNVQLPAAFDGSPEGELDRTVDRYFERLVGLVESELFDVAAHPDLIERTPPLRGRATDAHYRRAARAFERSRTLPELNAGRALGDGIVHPSPAFLDRLLERGCSIVAGSDSHHPDEIGDRTAFLAEYLGDRGVEPVEPPFERL